MALKAGMPPKAEVDQIMSIMLSDHMKENPADFVRWCYPWGQKNSPLERFKGPRAWQIEELEALGAHIKLQKKRMAEGLDPEMFKLGVASGRGPGKSALVAMLSHWFMSCVLGGTTILTANTHTQLADKTYGELNVWLTMAINSFFFESLSMSIRPAEWYADLIKDELKIGTKYYYVNGVLWQEDNPDSFVGAHSQHGMLVIYDEASGVPDNIWNATRGFFTEKTLYRIWAAFSNPRKNAGTFFDIFEDEKSGWRTRQINSLDVKEIDSAPLEEIVKKYGADSDEARVEVYGQFPKTGDRQFISRSQVRDAANRELDGYDNKDEPLVLGIDPARFGDDATVFRFRAGRDARTIPPQEFRGLDNMQIVDKVLQAIHTYNPDHIVIDSGAGAGIIDRLKQMGIKVHECLFGSSPLDPQYYDRRTELWGLMRDWLPGGLIDNMKELSSDLCTPEKETIGREDRVKLESKAKMKRRGIKSPNHGDALALTFHMKWAKAKVHKTAKGGKNRRHASWTKKLLD